MEISFFCSYIGPFTSTIFQFCCRFGHVYNNLQTRLTKTLLNAFLDPKRALTQQYGAIQGLAALGPNVVFSSPILPIAVKAQAKRLSFGLREVDEVQRGNRKVDERME
jgi:hypothetical protein